MRTLWRTCGVALLGSLLLAGPASAQQGGPGAPTPAVEGHAPRRIAVGQPRPLTLQAGAETLRLTVRETGIEDEFMVAATDPALPRLATLFGATLRWEAPGRLVVQRGAERLELGLGQEKLPEAAGGRQLDVPARVVDGVPHVPLSALEDLLDVRVTLADKANKGWVEPLITEVKLEGDGRKPKLVIRSSAPLTFKTFRLRQPDRFVIDIAGGVLDTPGLRVTHPELGDIRLGQFTLGPAVARVVIPAVPGVKIVAPAKRASREIAFGLELAGVEAPAQNFPAQKITDVAVEPMADGQRVVLTFSGPVQYEWSRLLPPDNRFFLDIPQAVLVGPKRDFELEGDEFVDAVRVSQFEAEPRPVARVVVDLQQPAETRVVAGETPNSLVLEIRHKKVEPSMAMLKGYGTTSFPSGGGVICIDPGHGGSDPGCMNRSLGVAEEEVTLDLSLRLAKILRARGWNVVMTRTDDRDVSWAGSSAREELGARVKIANDMGADVFVSIHCNASVSPSVNGTSIHAYKRSDHVLAQELHPSVVAATGRANRGIQKDRFYVLAHSKMPAVLIETAFLSHPEEGRLLANPEYRQRVAEAIADGLGRYASRYIKQTTAGR